MTESAATSVRGLPLPADLKTVEIEGVRLGVPRARLWRAGGVRAPKPQRPERLGSPA
jgi:hypothetical protein